MHWLLFRAGFLPAIQRYTAAAVVAGLAVPLRMVLVPLIGQTSPYLTSRLAVGILALVLGLGPGMLAGGTSILLIEELFVGGLTLSAEAMVRAVVLLVEAALLGWAGEWVRQAHARQLTENHRKDEFLAILSHELRNPLAPMRNSVFLLQREGAPPESKRRAIGILDRQTTQLTRLVSDLLDVSRIARGKVALERSTQDLSELTRETFEDLRSIIAGKGIVPELHVPDTPVWVNGDRARLVQIITNLVTNAVNFTPAGGHIRVTLRANGRAALEVRDDGVGIDPSTRDVLFEPFAPSRAPTDRAVPGLGLGLALARGFVELHGGSIVAFSDGPGTGARFVVTFPLTAAAQPESPSAQTQAASPTHRRVLVIEDNADSAESLREWLSLDGHEVEVAASGPEGLAKAERFRPEIVLCDIGLPGMDGYEVAEHLRSDPHQRSTLLVALTGYALPEDRARASQAGFAGVLAKPANPDELSTIVREHSIH